MSTRSAAPPAVPGAGPGGTTSWARFLGITGGEPAFPLVVLTLIYLFDQFNVTAFSVLAHRKTTSDQLSPGRRSSASSSAAPAP